MKTDYPWIKQCYYRISAKALIYNEEGKFALCLKEMMVHWELHTKWDIPGGGIDHGEHWPETISREIMEEMWIRVTHVNLHPKYFFVWESSCWTIPLTLVCYETELENFDYTPSDECREMRFFTLDEALEQNLYPAIRTTLEQAMRDFGKF